MGISFSRDQDKPFVANIDGTKHNFVIDEKTGLALPRNMTEPVMKTQSGVNTALNTIDSVELPPEAIIALAEGVRVISQRWLAHQLPPFLYVSAGREVFDENNPYLPEKKNQNKQQCWLKDGIWYWNKKGGEWLAAYHKGRIAEYSEIKKIYEKNKGNDNNETMSKMGVAKVGGLDAGNGERWNVGVGVARSATEFGNGNIRALWFEDGASVAHDDWIWNGDGAVPFIVLDTVSK